MTKDLAMLCNDSDIKTVNTEEFLKEINSRLKGMISL
jgi:isocitrate dehydrogenase